MHICGLLTGFIVIRFLIAGRLVATLPPPHLIPIIQSCQDEL